MIQAFPSPSLCLLKHDKEEEEAEFLAQDHRTQPAKRSGAALNLQGTDHSFIAISGVEHRMVERAIRPIDMKILFDKRGALTVNDID
jgi:hypothetical protein